MRGIIQLIPGDLASLVVSDNLSIPCPYGREILIRVNCAALNRMDLLQGMGKYPVPEGASPVIGIEVSGTVSTVGDDCEFGFKEGDEVMALLTGGGYAEFASVDERQIFRAIPGLDMQTLASIPEAFITAYQLCFIVGQVKPGDAVLLHAAASSVGQAAIQLMVRKGITVFATVRSEEKQSRCIELGCQECFVVSSDAPKFCDMVKLANGNKGVDVVLDPVGGTYLSENIDVLPVDGTMVLYGLMGGTAVTDPTFLAKLMAKRITIAASTLRSRSIEYKAAIVEALQSDPDGIAAIQSGDIQVQVDRTFLLEEVVKAHSHMSANANIGKIVLMVASSVSAIDFFQKELEMLAKKNMYKPTAYK